MKSTSLRAWAAGQTLALPTAVLKDVVGGVLQILLTGGSGGGSGGSVTIPDKPISILCRSSCGCVRKTAIRMTSATAKSA